MHEDDVLSLCERFNHIEWEWQALSMMTSRPPTTNKTRRKLQNDGGAASVNKKL